MGAFALVLVVVASSGLAGTPLDEPPSAVAEVAGTQGPGELLRSAPWTCAHEAVERLEPDATGVPLQDPVPPYESCSNRIRPGARMTEPVGCTFNFVFREGSTLYIGTAGHCVGTGQRVATAGVGTFGTVVFSVSQGSANDFALIRIDSAKHVQVDPTMCTWGGPTGTSDPPGVLDQEVLLQYGWGIATPFVPQTRSRIHDEFLSTSNVLRWNGVGSGGDSGSPLIFGDGRAAGIHTAGLTPVAGAVWEQGPTISRILEITADAGYDLELQTAPMRWRSPL